MYEECNNFEYVKIKFEIKIIVWHKYFLRVSLSII